MVDFEIELRNRIKERVEKDLGMSYNLFTSGDKISNITKNVLEGFEDILYKYNLEKYGNIKTNDEIWYMVDDFMENFTDNNLIKVYENKQFNEEENRFIKYTEAKKQWRDKSGYQMGSNYAITDIIVKDVIKEKMGKEGIKGLEQVIKKEVENGKKSDAYNHYLEMFSEHPYKDISNEMYEEEVNRIVELHFNDKINCGGYSLKIDTCVFPFYINGFDRNVSAVLENFPFTRLLGDEKLKEDEYIVLYRARENGSGHHFVRIDDDNIVREKDAAGKPTLFKNWRSLDKCKEAVFAVKKDHKMFGYGMADFRDIKALNFEGSVSKAIKEKNNNFEYHGHEFALKRTKDDEIVAVSNGEIVAYIVADEDDCVVEIEKEKNNYVQNFQPSIPLKINDSKFLNREDYIKEIGIER